MPVPIYASSRRAHGARHARCALLSLSLVACFVLDTASAGAQGAVTLSLAEARAAARRVSPELAAAREAVVAARARERQAGAHPNPTLAYSREQASGQGQSTAQSIAALEQPIELGGLRAARRDAARIRGDVAEARRATAEAQLDFVVARAYAAALAADRRAELAADATAAFGQALTVSERRLAAGDVSGYANRRIRLEAARYATIRAEAELARRTARLALAALVAPSADSISALTLVLSDSLSGDAPPLARLAATPSATLPDSLLVLAQRVRADLRASTLEASAAAADARVASRERLPVSVLSGGLKTERIEPASGASQDLAGFAAGIAIPLPLWDRRSGAIEAAAAESRRRLAETESLRRQVVREVVEAYDAWRVAEAQVTSLAPQLGAESRAALRAAQVAYSEGEIALVEWLDAVRAYQEAEASFATLRAEVLVRRAALEHAVGAPISATGSTSSTKGSGDAAPQE